jgi:molecular chaperone GrpE
LNDENTKLTNELNAYKDRLVKTIAEYENFRKRTAKEKEEIYNSACEDILKNVFPILDNIERAASIDGASDDIKKGLEMTLKQFNESLSKLQIEEIDASGEFDPNLHNAVMHGEDENIGKNTVVEVLQKGFKRGNKVLRHSMVKVVN